MMLVGCPHAQRASGGAIKSCRYLAAHPRGVLILFILDFIGNSTPEKDTAAFGDPCLRLHQGIGTHAYGSIEDTAAQMPCSLPTAHRRACSVLRPLPTVKRASFAQANQPFASHDETRYGSLTMYSAVDLRSATCAVMCWDAMRRDASVHTDSQRAKQAVCMPVD